MLPLIPLVLSIAPEIAKWLFGDDAAKVTTQVAGVVQQVAGTVDPDIAATRLAGDPAMANDLRVKLAQIAADRERAQREADQAALAAQLADVANARAQTVALAQAGSRAVWAPVVISAAVLVTFGVVMYVSLTRAMPAGSETVLNMLLGTLAAMATSVVSYWVGSSRGSERKTELLAQSAPVSSGS